MTQPRPSAEELLDAVHGFLSSELLPTLEGRLGFQTRVALNAIATVTRELRDGPAADDDERRGLRTLLGASADADSLDALNRDLAARLRAGELAVDDPELIAHLRRTARADVAIANPKWLPEEGD